MNHEKLAPRLFNAVSVLTAVGVCVIAYYAFFPLTISPLLSQRLVSIEAVPGHTSSHVLITHEFCTRHDGEAEAVRVFRRIPVREGDALLVFETVPVRTRLQRGCDTRTRRVDLPENFPAGRYNYEMGLRWCGAFGRCETDWLPPAVVVVGPEAVNRGANGQPGNRTITVE